MNISKTHHQLKKENEVYPISETPSAILVKSIIETFAEYYQCQLKEKIEKQVALPSNAVRKGERHNEQG